MLLETLTQNELQQARVAIIKVIAGYEREILVEVCDGLSIDTSRLAELRDTIATLRGVLRDIASADSKLSSGA